MNGNIWYKEKCYLIQGVVFDVYREMGSGFLEAVYQKCMAKALSKHKIPFAEHQELRIFYKGETLLQTYMPDFICYESIIVELKALSCTTGAHKAQVLNYLKTIGMRLGLLVNSGCYPRATVERIVL